MENTTSSSSASTPEIGTDRNQLKGSTSASVAELREFMSEFKGRKPEEVMGHVAQSDLIRSIGMATGAIAALILVLTIVPYSLSSGEPAGSQVSRGQQQPSAPATEADKPQSSATETADNGAPDLERASEAMQLNTTEAADPDKNPLADKFEKLLEDPD